MRNLMLYVGAEAAA